jgi:hypothetical protein
MRLPFDAIKVVRKDIAAMKTICKPVVNPFTTVKQEQ